MTVEAGGCHNLNINDKENDLLCNTLMTDGTNLSCESCCAVMFGYGAMGEGVCGFGLAFSCASFNRFGLLPKRDAGKTKNMEMA